MTTVKGPGPGAVAQARIDVPQQQGQVDKAQGQVAQQPQKVDAPKAKGIDAAFADVGIQGGSEAVEGGGMGGKLMASIRGVFGAFVRSVDEKTATAQLDQAVDDMKDDNKGLKLDLVKLRGEKKNLEDQIGQSKGQIETLQKRLTGAKATFTELNAKGDTAAASRAKEEGLGFAAAIQKEQTRLARLEGSLQKIEASIEKATTAVNIHERKTEETAAAADDAKRDHRVGRMQDRAAEAIDNLTGVGETADRAMGTLRRQANEGEARLDMALETGVGREIAYEVKADEKAAQDLWDKS